VRIRLIATGALVAVLAAACGGGHAGHSNATSAATKTIAIEMRDIAYSPTALTVKKGDTVKFVFTNKGAAAHDAFIGDEAAQAAHEKEMSAMPGMDHGGHGADAVTVQPGGTASLEHTFAATGITFVGCHQTGHYAAGMRVTVTVT
jgi:uncharacterized cupredoxin-like copper-binding protein